MSTENSQNTENTVDNDPIFSAFMQDIGGTEEPPVQSTEASEDPAVEQTGSDAPANAEPTEPEKVEEIIADDKTDENKPSFNPIEYLEQSSEGFIKNEEDFKSVVAKAKEYENLQKEIEELKAEKETIFANETIKLENKLIKEGKTDEQIAEFKRLAKLDIASLDPKEVLIQREIKNGHTRQRAEMVVERKYGLDKLSFDEDLLTSEELAANKNELEFINDQMKVDAEPVRKEMQEEFKSLTTEISPSEKALREAAALKSYKEKLEPFATKIQSDFPKKLSIGDDETGVFSYDVNQEFLDSLKESAINYFTDTEVNPENVEIFVRETKKEWLYQNQKEILKNLKASVEAATEKRVRAEFENPQGLPKNTEAPVVQSKNIEDELFDIAKSH